MKLEDYITESLKEIITGVRNAQTYAKEAGARINPNGMGINRMGQPYINYSSRDVGQTGQMVEFDVVVTISEGDQVKAGIGVFAGSFGIGTQGKTEANNIAVNRIKFTVPIFLPEQ